MTVGELREALEQYPPDALVGYYDDDLDTRVARIFMEVTEITPDVGVMTYEDGFGVLLRGVGLE